MKIFIVLTACVLLAGTQAATVADVYDGPVYELGDNMGKVAYNPLDVDSTFINVPHVEPAEGEHVRVRRFTCDALSFQSKWVSPNHSACALRCLSLRKKGGRCQNGICVCRN